MSDLEHLIQILQSVAKRNDDKFEYRIEIEPGRHGMLYRFVATESADNHEFVSGSGGNLHDAIKEAREGIVSACEDWQYIFPT